MDGHYFFSRGTMTAIRISRASRAARMRKAPVKPKCSWRKPKEAEITVAPMPVATVMAAVTVAVRPPAKSAT